MPCWCAAFLGRQEAQKQEGERRGVCIGVRTASAAPMFLPTCPAGYLAGWLTAQCCCSWYHSAGFLGLF